MYTISASSNFIHSFLWDILIPLCRYFIFTKNRPWMKNHFSPMYGDIMHIRSQCRGTKFFAVPAEHRYKHLQMKCVPYNHQSCMQFSHNGLSIHIICRRLFVYMAFSISFSHPIHQCAAKITILLCTLPYQHYFDHALLKIFSQRWQQVKRYLAALCLHQRQSWDCVTWFPQFV